MNPIGYKAPIMPQTQYVGAKPDTYNYVRRSIKQLNDIEFSSDEEPEDIAVLRRQHNTVLTEENLRNVLTDETMKINLEHHYWLSNNFLSKLGRMAPNL